MMSTVLLTILLTVPLASSKPSFSIETDSVVFPAPENSDTNSEKSRFTEPEVECFEKYTVLFNYSCETLLKKGSCPDGYWLILDYQSAKLPEPKITPKCMRIPCSKAWFYWPNNRKCYSKLDASILCPSGNMLVNDVFGEGACQCTNEPPHGAINNGTCYPLYTRGPCRNQWIFIEKNDSRNECIPDKCYLENERNRGNKTMVYWEKDMRCYRLGEKGPCPDGETIRVDLVTKKPACLPPSPVAILNLVNVPQICGTDHKGQCATEIKIPKANERFVASILAQADRKRNKRKLNEN